MINQNKIGQPMFKFLDEIQSLERKGKKILHFELGEPDFNTPKNIIDKCIEKLNGGATHYENSYGLYEFRKSVQEATLLSRGFQPDIDQIMIAPGANSIIFFALRALVNSDDEVLIPDPGFPSYESAINLVGAKIKKIPLHESNNFELDPHDFKKSISSKTKVLILNSPSNPTGAVIHKDKIAEIAKIALENNIFIISDEIYAKLIFKGSNTFSTPSFIDCCKQNTLIINGFSKSYAMTGWRLGVAIGPIKLIQQMTLILQTIVSCVPPFVQYAGMEAIVGDQSDQKKMLQSYEERMNLMVDGFNNIKGMKCVRPGGSIYVFPNIKNTGLSSEEFQKKVLDELGIALLSGTNFGVYGEGYVRLCCVRDVDEINKMFLLLESSFGKNEVL